MTDHIDYETVVTNLTLTDRSIAFVVSVEVINPSTAAEFRTSLNVNAVQVVCNDCHSIFVNVHNKTSSLRLCVHTILNVPVVTLLVSEVRDDTAAPRADERYAVSLCECLNLVFLDTLLIEVLAPSRVSSENGIVAPVTLNCNDADEVVRHKVRRTNPAVRNVAGTTVPVLSSDVITRQILSLVNEDRDFICTTVSKVHEVALLETASSVHAQTCSSNLLEIVLRRNPETTAVVERRVRSLTNEWD